MDTPDLIPNLGTAFMRIKSRKMVTSIQSLVNCSINFLNEHYQDEIQTRHMLLCK